MALPQETGHDNSKRLGGSDLVRKDSPSLSKACSVAAIVVEQTESSGGDSYSPKGISMKHKNGEGVDLAPSPFSWR